MGPIGLLLLNAQLHVPDLYLNVVTYVWYIIFTAVCCQRLEFGANYFYLVKLAGSHASDI